MEYLACPLLEPARHRASANNRGTGLDAGLPRTRDDKHQERADVGFDCEYSRTAPTSSAWCTLRASNGGCGSVDAACECASWGSGGAVSVGDEAGLVGVVRRVAAPRWRVTEVWLAGPCAGLSAR